eukprot:7981141-Pyramimonas_sp.AAC.1
MMCAGGGLASVAERMGRAHLMATLVLVGPRVAHVAQALLEHTMPPLVRHCFTRCRAASHPAVGRHPPPKPLTRPSAAGELFSALFPIVRGRPKSALIDETRPITVYSLCTDDHIGGGKQRERDKGSPSSP